MIDLSGKVAIARGGSCGIGRGTAEELAEQGARVVVEYVSHAEAVCRSGRIHPNGGRHGRSCSVRRGRRTGNDATKSMLSQTGSGRRARGAKVAAPVVFLASDEAGYITGHALRANGGMHM